MKLQTALLLSLILLASLAALLFAGPTVDSLTFLPLILGDAAEPPSPTPSTTATTAASTNTPTSTMTLLPTASATATATVMWTATSTKPATMTPTKTATPKPSATPTKTATPKPTATKTPAPPAGCTICSYDAYNCGDFKSQSAAQACFNYCMSKVGYDVHNLDADDDGIACESLTLSFGGWRFRWP